jgi:hypothetical protein
VYRLLTDEDFVSALITAAIVIPVALAFYVVLRRIFLGAADRE